MNRRCYLPLLVITLLMAACERPAPPVQSPPRPPTTIVETELARNMEQVPYCLPIPKGEYVRDHAREQELPRGSIAYEHKTRKADTIEIHGLLRSDTKTSVADYFRKSYVEGEEPGKAIEEKTLLEAQGVFYAKGYWSNKIHEERFIEITWLRKDDVVRYTANFPVSEWPAWQQRLEGLLKHNSRCE